MEKKSGYKKAVLAIISILLSAFIAEGILCVIYPAETKYFVWQPNLKHIFHADTTILRGVRSESRFTINPQGIRTEQHEVDLFQPAGLSKEEKYYLCLGGSTTECLYLDDSATWPAQVMRSAAMVHDSTIAFVGNIGKSGCSTRENYIQLKYCVNRYRKVNAVIAMVGLNDLLRCLAQDSLFDAAFDFTRAVEDSFVKTIFLKQGRGAGRTWCRRTALFYLLQNVYQRNKSTGVNWMLEDDSGKTEQQWRKNRQMARVVLDSLPDLSAALDEFERNLNLMIDEAERQHLSIVFVNQSALWKTDMDGDELASLWMGGIGKYQQETGHAYYSPAALRRGLDLYNGRLARVCARRKVKLIDLDGQIPHNATVFYDDCHFTDYGAALAGNLIYRWLVKY